MQKAVWGGSVRIEVSPEGGPIKGGRAGNRQEERALLGVKESGKVQEKVAPIVGKKKRNGGCGDSGGKKRKGVPVDELNRKRKKRKRRGGGFCLREEVNTTGKRARVPTRNQEMEQKGSLNEVWSLGS